MPLIKGMNSTRENIKKTATFINSLDGNRELINLLPYHNIAGNKYLKLGNSNNFIEYEAPDEMEVQEIISVFGNFGIKASIGG